MSDISFIKNNQIDKLDFGSGLVLKVFFDEENGARNFSLGTVTIEPNCETSMHTRTVEEVIYMISGEGEVVTEEGERYTLLSGDSILIPAGISHKHVNSSEKSLEQMWIFAPQGEEVGLRDLPKLNLKLKE